MLGSKLICVMGALILVFSPSSRCYPIEELKKEADRLKMLYELALQQEVQSESKPAEGRERSYAQHEKVKSYKDYTDEERKQAELEHIMEIAKIMGKFPGGGPSPDTFCHASETDDTVTSGELKEMIDAMHRVFELHFFTTKHYVVANYGQYRKIDVSSQADALQEFFNDYPDTHLPDKLWITNSPCVSCSKIIMSRYSRNTSKATIFIANVTAGASVLETVESFKCMAKMVHMGFNISAWDWKDFRNNLNVQACIDDINEAISGTNNFMAATENIESFLEYIRQTSTSSHIMSWCPLPNVIL